MAAPKYGTATLLLQAVNSNIFQVMALGHSIAMLYLIPIGGRGPRLLLEL